MHLWLFVYHGFLQLYVLYSFIHAALQRTKSLEVTCLCRACAPDGERTDHLRRYAESPSDYLDPPTPRIL
jgi:hypothetical protein